MVLIRSTRAASRGTYYTKSAACWKATQGNRRDAKSAKTAKERRLRDEGLGEVRGKFSDYTPGLCSATYRRGTATFRGDTPRLCYGPPRLCSILPGDPV